MAELQKIKVIGVRPTHESHTGRPIQADWNIWNAPRPLFGCETWTGPFYHGIFYAATDPADTDCEIWEARNISLDAWLLTYVAEDQAVAEALSHYKQKFPEEAAEIDPADPDHRRWLVDAWLDLQKDKLS